MSASPRSSAPPPTLSSNALSRMVHAPEGVVKRPCEDGPEVRVARIDLSALQQSISCRGVPILPGWAPWTGR